MLHHAQLSEAVARGSEATLQAMPQLAAAGQTPEQAAATINRLLDQQAYTMAVTDVFYLSAALFVALIGVVWLTRPRLVSAASGGGAH